MKMFNAMQAMMDADDKGIAVSNTVTNVQKVKAGGLVTFGVDDERLNQVMEMMVSSAPGQNKHYVLCLVVDKAKLDLLMAKGDE